MCIRKRTPAWLVAFAFILVGHGFVLGQISSDKARLERLTALGRLWTTIEYFHPYLAYRHDIDWDAALVAAIPKVKAAVTAVEYATAVHSMLAVLGDPATRVIEKPPPIGSSRLHQPQHATYRVTMDHIGIWVMGDHSNRPDLALLEENLKKAASDFPRLRGIVFDLRSQTPSTVFTRALTFLLSNSDVARKLSSKSYVTPAERSRMPGAFQMSDAHRVEPAEGARDIPVVFVINEHSDLPLEMFALQAAGNAKIVAEGHVTDESVTTTSDVSLADGVIARIRVGELVFEEGVRPFQADVLAVPDSNANDRDKALTAAESLIRDFDRTLPPRPYMPGLGASRVQKSYSESSFPAVEYRLMAAFRLWGAVNYQFPYRALMTADWDEVLQKAVLDVENADDARAYHLAIAEMAAHIGDSHGVIQSSVLGEYFGTAAPPVRVRLIEGLPVITGFRDEQAARQAGVEIGDVILRVDDEPVNDRMARYAKFVAASTPQALTRDVLDRRSTVASTGGILFGAPHSKMTLAVRGRTGQHKTVTLPRRLEWAGVLEQRSGDILKLLPGGIGYADLDRFTSSMIDEMFEKFSGTKAIVFDMRGYPRGISQADLASRLTDRPSVRVALFERMIPALADNRASITARSTTQIGTQTFRGSGSQPYRGRTVMLMDERTQSAAEHLGLFLKAANGTIFVGTHTAGANGNAGPMALPGGLRVSRSFLGVKHPDGRQLQRIGLVPDIEVRPTIKGLQSNRDEVLEAAIAYLNRP